MSTCSCSCYFGCRDVLWELSCLVDLFTFWSRRVFEVKPVTRGVSGGPGPIVPPLVKKKDSMEKSAFQ